MDEALLRGDEVGQRVFEENHRDNARKDLHRLGLVGLVLVKLLNVPKLDIVVRCGQEKVSVRRRADANDRVIVLVQVGHEDALRAPGRLAGGLATGKVGLGANATVRGEPAVEVLRDQPGLLDRRGRVGKRQRQCGNGGRLGGRRGGGEGSRSKCRWVGDGCSKRRQTGGRDPACGTTAGRS